MKCPKCPEEMEPVAYHEIEVDRCRGCGGLWFDEFELDQLSNRSDPELLDTGNPQVGKQHNAASRVPCPRCGGTGKMIPMVDLNQPHIWFESCGVCHGVFLDAGEFTDLQKKSLGDYIKDLFAGERK